MDPKIEDKDLKDPSIINARLLELTTENAQLKAEVLQYKKDAELMQVDYSNKLANAQVEHESKVLVLNRNINELHKQLEARSVVENRIRDKGRKKTVNQIYEEAFGD